MYAGASEVGWTLERHEENCGYIYRGASEFKLKLALFGWCDPSHRRVAFGAPSSFTTRALLGHETAASRDFEMEKSHRMSRLSVHPRLGPRDSIFPGNPDLYRTVDNNATCSPYLRECVMAMEDCCDEVLWQPFKSSLEA